MAVSNAIVVVNAGSSSIKFSLFGDGGADLAAFLNGEIEGLYTDSAHFVAKDTTGGVVAEQRWDGKPINHDAGMREILDFVGSHLGDHKVEAVGHRIVHGGADFAAPVRLDAAVLARLEKLIPLAPLHQPHNLAPVRTLLEIAPHLPQVGCFDTRLPRGASRRWPRPSRCRRRSPTAACGDMGSMACRMNTSPRCCRRWTRNCLARG